MRVARVAVRAFHRRHCRVFGLDPRFTLELATPLWQTHHYSSAPSIHPSERHSWQRIFRLPYFIQPLPSHRAHSVLVAVRTGSSTTSSGYFSAPATRNMVRNGSAAIEVEPSSMASSTS